MKATLQLLTAAVMSIGGLILLFCGVFIDPQGEIDGSLLIGFGEVATFAGALFGIDYTYRYKRRSKVGNAVTGQIYLSRWVGDGAQFNSLENAAYIIPAGTYEVRITHSPKFRKDLPLLIGVPGRDGIRIHTGNKPEHSLGCILVGAAGKKLIEELIRINNSFNEKTYICIRDAFGSAADTTWQPDGQKVTPWHPQLALPPAVRDNVRSAGNQSE